MSSSSAKRPRDSPGGIIDWSVVAVLDDDHLVGVAVIERILGASGGATIGDVMDPDPPTVTPDTDEEHAAWQAAQDGKPGLAVVDADGRFRGLIAPQQLLTVLAHEHDEDLARLGGFMHSVEAARTTSVETVVRRLWHRLPGCSSDCSARCFRRV